MRRFTQTLLLRAYPNFFRMLLSLLLMMCVGWIACVHAHSAERRLPTLHLNFEPKDVEAMKSVTFSVFVEGGKVGISFVWDFDASDGMQVDAIGARATHIYPVAGGYEIRVTATDGRGRTRIASTRVTVTARKYMPHAPITLADQIFLPDQPHIIEGYEIRADGENAIYLRNCANVVIRNCYLHDSDYAILAEGCRNIQVIGCYVDKNERGVLFEGSPENLSDDIQVNYNFVTRCLRTDGISFRWAADVEVDGNVLKDNGQIWEDRISGISFNGLFRNISIHDNFVARSNSDGIELMGERQGERSRKVEVYNNMLRDNGEQGVWLLHVTESRVHHNIISGSHNNGVFLEWDVSKVGIDHNIIVNCGGIPGMKHHGGGAIGIWYSFSDLIENNVLTKSTIAGISIGCPESISHRMRKEGYYPFTSRDNIIRNNIIVDNVEGNIAVDAEIPGTQIRYNNVWQGKGGRNYRGCKPGPGNISADPRFRNPIAGDFTLRDDSPCIDAGEPEMQTTTDDFVLPRDADGSRVDMGIAILKKPDTRYVGIIERRPDIPFFGIEEDFDKANDIVSLTSKDLRDLGVKIVRTHGGPFVWDSIEPRKGEFDFTLTDKAVKEAFYSGVSIIASLWPYALWDQGDIESCKVSGKIDAMRGRTPDYRCKPQDMKAYRHFLKELVERYDGDDDFGNQPISNELKEIIKQNPVIYWEIDNEVDAGDNRKVAKFFVGSLEDYVDLLKNSYKAIKAASEACQVIVAAPAGSIRDYYSHLFSLGARDYFNVYNLHGPIQELRETVGLPREISSGRYAVESTSIPYLTGSLDKPVFITEAGGKEGAEMAKEAILLASEGFTLAILNMAPDWPKYRTKNLDGAPNEEFFRGYLLSKDGSKASAYYALQTLTTELEYFKKIEPIEVGIGLAGFKFYFEEKDPVYVFFIDKFGKMEETISVEFGRFTVKDLYGTEKTMEGKSFTLKKDNVYFVKPYAESKETQTFYEDFESEIDDWDLSSGWSIISVDGNHVLQGTQHTFATAYLDGVVNELELKLKLLQGTIHLNIRSEPSSEGLKRYFIGFNKDGSYIRKQPGGNFQPLIEHGRGISLDEWHKIRIEIIHDTIEVFSDGNPVLSVQDKDVIREGGISFETLEDSRAYIDDVRVETVVPEARQIQAEELFPDGEHKGDITLEGRDFLILENGRFEQFGDVYLKDSSQLILRNAKFYISRHRRLLNHWGIYLEDKASLEIEGSKVAPGKEALVVIHARDRTRVDMKNSPTRVHLFTISDNAEALVEDSEIVGEIGGLVSAYGNADIKVINSKIGAVNLWIPPGATFEASGLGTGFFQEWSLQEDTKVSGIDYNITLKNTELVKDTIGPGPFERGWPVFIDSGANVVIKNSELRKVVIELHDEKAEFANFALETPTDFNYRNIHLENVTVKGQWGVFLHGSSEVIVRDSDAFWTFIYGDSKLTLVNTHINEFDPRNFHGRIIFENSRWDTAAEIIENNDFTIKGSLEIGEIGGFSWENSRGARVYDVIGKPNTELILRKEEKTAWQGMTDEHGVASFKIQFDDTNFSDSWELRDNFGNRVKVDFFSATPIKLP